MHVCRNRQLGSSSSPLSSTMWVLHLQAGMPFRAQVGGQRAGVGAEQAAESTAGRPNHRLDFDRQALQHVWRPHLVRAHKLQRGPQLDQVLVLPHARPEATHGGQNNAAKEAGPLLGQLCQLFQLL
jgi:hypothetical protein